MTIYKAGTATFRSWGSAIERELDLTQALAADPHRNRTFRLIGQQEFMALTGQESPWGWTRFTKSLKDAGQLVSVGNRAQVTLAQVHAFMDANKIRPRRPEGVPRAMRIAVANFKGGAAKSTTSFHAGTKLAMDGYRVCLIDLDGQATLTRMMALQPYLLKSEQTFAAAIGMYDEGTETLIGDPRPLQPIKTYIDGLDIIPAGMAVTSIDMELMNRIGEGESNLIQSMFATALGEVDKDYDFVIMDFQPSFSLSQLLVMQLADSLILPVPTETPDFAGTGDFLRLAGKWLAELEELFGGSKTFDPVLALHVRAKLTATSEKTLSEKERQDLEERLRASNAVYGSAGRVFGNHRPMQVVEDRQVVSKCLSNLKSVYEADANDYDPRAIKAARAQYDALVGRILEAVKLRWEEVAANGGSYETHQ